MISEARNVDIFLQKIPSSSKYLSENNENRAEFRCGTLVFVVVGLLKLVDLVTTNLLSKH